jgi:hypothetical protein
MPAALPPARSRPLARSLCAAPLSHPQRFTLPAPSPRARAAARPPARPQLLEENYVLLKTISEQHNLGRFDDAAAQQARLQANLVALAKVADTQQAAQPPAPAPQPQ